SVFGASPDSRCYTLSLHDALPISGFHEFGMLGYEADEPELEVDGERWDAGPCIYSNPTDGTVEGRVRRLGTHSIGGFFPKADVFAVEDEDGRELARLLMTPFGGPAIPFLTGARQIAVGPAVFLSGQA